MKLTNKQLRQIIKEELEYALQEQMISGYIDITTEGASMANTSYRIGSATGEFGGVQALTISARGFAKNRSPEQAENMANIWTNYLANEHGLKISTEDFIEAIKREKIAINVQEVKKNRDAYMY